MAIELLESLGRACLHGGVLAGVMWLMTRWVRNVPLTLQRWGWWLVCAKSLLALVGWIWINLPLLPVPNRESGVETFSIVSEAPMSKAPTPYKVERQAQSSERIARGGLTALIQYVPSALLCLWMMSVVALVWGMIRRWVGVERLWRAAQPLSDTEWRRRIQQLCVQMELAFVPCVRFSCGAHPPMALLGGRVLIPSTLWKQLSDEERLMTLTHEFAHLQRGDAWWSIVPMLAQTLLFFFPPIRYAARQWELGCETASDTATLRYLGCTSYAYGALLLKIAEQMRPTVIPLTAGTTHNFAYLRTRLQQLRPEPRAAKSIGALVLGLVGLLALPWRLTAQIPSVHQVDWHQKLSALRQVDWGEAYETGIELASLPPERGYALLAEHWACLPMQARQQMLKAFYYTRPYPLRPRVHPKLLAVLELGINDRSPSVRSWAKSYLEQLTLREFEDADAVRVWIAQHRDLPIAQVVRMHWEPFLRELPRFPDAERIARLRRLVESSAWLRESTIVRPLALRYHLPEWLTPILHTNMTDANQVAFLQGVLECLFALSLSERELRPALAPLLKPDGSCVPSLRAYAVRLLGSPRYAWATADLLTLARHAVEQPIEPLLWAALAETFQSLGEAQALSILHEMLARTDNPTLRQSIKQAIDELEGNG